MKNRVHRKRTTYTRLLKPKLALPMQNLAIQSLTFIHDADGGITYMTINPNHITLNSRELISMIEDKRDRIDTGTNGCILGRDILAAIHNHPTKSDKPTVSENHNDNVPCAIKVDEPKRPANAFILYNNALRKKVKNLFPNYSNSEVSKIIGGMWKSVSDSDKNKYIKQAIECRKLHKELYPNFEYNIKRGSATGCTNFSDIQKTNGWENYFDWCLQNSATESSAGILQYNEFPYNGLSTNWSDSTTQPDFVCDELNDYSTQNFQTPGEWNEVCQIVSRFFPGRTDQNDLMDEEFWKSLTHIPYRGADPNAYQ